MKKETLLKSNNMKKILFAILFLFNVVCVFSQNYSKEQESLRNEITDYLKKQGLNPEKQDDGLKFKSEGSTYYIEIDKDAKEPMYVRLRRYIKYDDNFDKNKIAENLNEYNVKFGVKVFCQEKSFVISAEMFLTKASEFNYVFDTFLLHIKSAYKLVNE